MSCRLVNRRLFSGTLVQATLATHFTAHTQASAAVGLAYGCSVKYKDNA